MINLSLDFKSNSLVVAVYGKKIVGFCCYTTYDGKILLMWRGVKRNRQVYGGLAR